MRARFGSVPFAQTALGARIFSASPTPTVSPSIIATNIQNQVAHILAQATTPPPPAPAATPAPAPIPPPLFGEGDAPALAAADAIRAMQNSQTFYESESRQGKITAAVGGAVAAGGGLLAFKGHPLVGVLAVAGGAIAGWMGWQRWRRAEETYQAAQQRYAASQAATGPGTWTTTADGTPIFLPAK